MPGTESDNGRSCIFVGLGGETAPGRTVDTGLYRMADGENEWELLDDGLPEAAAIRALAVHPERPEVIYAGTQDGPYRSSDHGDHWEKMAVPNRGLPVWSIMFHPRDPDIVIVGFENCEIYRSDDGGESWRRLPVNVRFPEITTAPGANLAKRVLMLDANVGNPDMLYAAIEVGGVIRSNDGGAHWENLSHGQYTNDDTVDMHGVLVSRWRPGTIFAIGRAGLFSSTNEGDYWRHVPLEPLNEKGQVYCRDIREVPGNPRKIWIAAGANFQSETGVLLYSRDGGDSWSRVDMGLSPGATMFALAFDQRRPSRMSCATNGGEVFASNDSGDNWQILPPLPQGRQIYALAQA